MINAAGENSPMVVILQMKHLASEMLHVETVIGLTFKPDVA